MSPLTRGGDDGLIGPFTRGGGGGGGGGGGILLNGEEGREGSGIGGGGGRGSGVTELRGGVDWEAGGDVKGGGVSTGGGGGGGRVSLPALILLPRVGVFVVEDTVGVLKEYIK